MSSPKKARSPRKLSRRKSRGIGALIRNEAPPNKGLDAALLMKLRGICLALPEAFEKEAWGECTFRVTGGTMFAMTDNNHHDSGHIAVWVKASAMVQEILINSDPERFFKPPYVGHKGWVGVRLQGKVDWDAVADILRDGYVMSAPPKARAAAPSGTAKGDIRKGQRNAKLLKPRRRVAKASAPPHEITKARNVETTKQDRVHLFVLSNFRVFVIL